MKRVAFLALLLFILTALMLPASAKIVEPGLDSRYSIIVDDNRDLLTDEEEIRLVEDMRPISKYGTVVFLSSDGGFGSNDEIALRYLEANVSTDRNFSVTMFHIDMGHRQLVIFSRGALRRSVTISSAYSITGDVSHWATSKEYYTCAEMAFQNILKQIETGHVASSMRWICSVLLAFAIALYAAFSMVHWGEEKRRKERNLILSAWNTVTDVKMEITEQELVNQTKTRRSSDSDSGSSCGGGGCGGGGSSCGGGGSSGF